MTDKINGQIVNGEHLTSDVDFWTIYTAHTLTAGTDVNSATPTGADNLDRIINFVGTRAGAIMVSVASTGSVTLTSAPYSLGTSFDAAGTATAYTLKFATEHTGAWSDTASAANNLKESLDGLPLPVTADFSIHTAADTNLVNTSDAALTNTTVVKALTL